MNLENKKITEKQLEELILLFDNIDPDNKIFNKPKKLAEKKRYEMRKNTFNKLKKQRGKER